MESNPSITLLTLELYYGQSLGHVYEGNIVKECIQIDFFSAFWAAF